MCGDYEDRVKNFQITRITPSEKPQINQVSQPGTTMPQRKSVINSGLNSALIKNRGDKARHGFNIRSKKGKSSQAVPIWRIKPPEDKDKFEWKEKVYRKYLEHIAKSNGIITPEDSTTNTQQFRYFVGRGNFSYLVKHALKRRFWWTNGSRDDEWDEFNFIWTQWRRKPIIKSLKLLAQESSQKNLANPSQNSTSNMNEESTTCLTDCSPNENLSDIERTSSSKHRSKSSRKVRGLESKILAKSASPESQIEHTLYNHMECNYHLSNKKALYYNMKAL